MANELLVNGIAAALHARYPSYPIYKEDIPQGFDRPCFYIQSRDTSHKEGLHYTALRTYPFVVHFFPEKDDYHGREQCRKMADALYDILEYLRLSNDMLRRGYDMKGEITEDCVLQFHVYYALHYYRYYEHKKMRKLTIDLEAER